MFDIIQLAVGLKAQPAAPLPLSTGNLLRLQEPGPSTQALPLSLLEDKDDDSVISMAPSLTPSQARIEADRLEARNAMYYDSEYARRWRVSFANDVPLPDVYDRLGTEEERERAWGRLQEGAQYIEVNGIQRYAIDNNFQRVENNYRDMYERVVGVMQNLPRGPYDTRKKPPKR